MQEVAKAVGGSYCRLQMPLKPALGVRETVSGHRLGTLEGGGGGGSPPFQCTPPPPPCGVVVLRVGATSSVTAPRITPHHTHHHRLALPLIWKVCAFSGCNPVAFGR